MSVATLAAVLLVTLLSGGAAALAAAGATSPTAAGATWQVVERLNDDGAGHDFAQFAEAVDVMREYVVAASTTANAAKGACRVYRDTGAGLVLLTVLRDPDGKHGDGFGSLVRLFDFEGVVHVAVAAPTKRGTGEVLVFKEHTPGAFTLQVELTAPQGNDGKYATNFGRTLNFDGKSILIGAVARYHHSLRYEVAAINIKGTRMFLETTGSEPLGGGDPLFAFNTKKGRDGTTFIAYSYTVQAAPDHLDFGASVALDGNTMLVGAPVRDESRYGHGNDGSIVVTGRRVLTGTAEYNFEDVTVESGGVLTVDYFDSLRGNGGVLNIKVRGTLHVKAGGVIELSERGFEGAPARKLDSRMQDGYGPGGGTTATSTLVGGTRCGYGDTTGTKDDGSGVPFAEANGGGGSYGTAGQPGTAVQCGDSGAAGATYGADELVELHRGSGGGAGFPWHIGTGGQGGAGGGIAIIFAREVVIEGTIRANGANGGNGGFYSGGGGAGSGGSIYIGGVNLTNTGSIEALGGSGGTRSSSSGSLAHAGVTGGSGGQGRIRLEFLTITAEGTITPAPFKTLKFEGTAYIFKRPDVDAEWALHSELPRTADMKFTGQAVGLHGDIGAVTSTNRHAISPMEEVTLFRISDVVDVSTSLPDGNLRVLTPEFGAPGEWNFGARLEFGAGGKLLAVSSPGNDVAAPGRLVLYTTATDFIAEATRSVSLQQLGPAAGDAYSATAAVAYPVIAAVCKTHDDGYAGSSGDGSRMSQGTVHIWRHRLEVDPAQSSVECDETRATQHTVVGCKATLLTAGGVPVGDRLDLKSLAFPAGAEPKLIAIGIYTFPVTAATLGTMPVAVTYGGTALTKSMHSIEVTAAITTATAMSCTPGSLPAGQEVTCTLTVPGGVGEQNAAPHFMPVVYNLYDAALHVDSPVVDTFFGRFRPPPTDVRRGKIGADFETVLPTVMYVSAGSYEFKFKPWRPGKYAVVTTYRNQLLDEASNPATVTANDPAISPTESSVVCPSMAAINRTVACTLTLRGADAVPTGLVPDPEHDTTFVAGAIDPAAYKLEIQAKLGGVPITTSLISARQGRISVLAFPDKAGKLTVDAKIDGSAAVPFLPTGGTEIRDAFPKTCAEVSTVLSSFLMFRQAGQSVVPPAVYIPGEGLCAEPGI